MTPEDELKIEHKLTASTFTEIYVQNDDTGIFYFDTNDVNYINSIHEQLISGQLSRQIGDTVNPSPQEQVILELNDFDEFYETTNSLFSNEEGELVTQFIGSEDIADWLVISHPDTSGGEEIYLIPDEICILAGECAVLKCPFGGPANYLCDACVAVVVICVIERFIEHFF